MNIMQTIAYIDGFNLYYRAAKPNHRWLNIEALCSASLSSTCTIKAVKYYTAHVSGRTDPGAPARQNAYLAALKTLPLVSIHYGNFLSQVKFAGLVTPLSDFRPTPQVVKVWKTEEKGRM